MADPSQGRRYRQRRRTAGEPAPVLTSVRLEAGLHQALAELAARRQVSVNRVINELLADAIGRLESGQP